MPTSLTAVSPATPTGVGRLAWQVNLEGESVMKDIACGDCSGDGSRHQHANHGASGAGGVHPVGPCVRLGDDDGYNFRGITQSNHKPSVAAYLQPRYNINADLQAYVGLSGESISFPNRAAAEVDFYRRLSA